MATFPLPGDLAHRNASELARSLCEAGPPSELRPFWADGGRTEDTFAPTRHILAAYPSRTGEVQVDALPFRGLPHWLRSEPRVDSHDSGLLVLGLSYDAGRNMERVPTTAKTDPSLPDLVFAHYPAYIGGPSENGPWQLHAARKSDADRLIRGLRHPVTSREFPAISEPMLEATAWPEYENAIRSVLAAIEAGDLYQANIARRIETDFPTRSTPALYTYLRESNPSAYGTLWCLGSDTWLASSSPECLFSYDAERREARSFPIKGTRRRGASDAEDRTIARALRADPKDMAEHVMIVDLIRNDLGRVSHPGTVEVKALATTYRLPTVHHLVSDIRGVLCPTYDLVDLILALFPGGSITGAPKIAAMLKIEEVEGLRRGFYTGSVGFVEPDGNATFNILIRTCVAHRDRLYYQTGGGIVADSAPSEEWDETCAKAYAVTRLLERGRETH